MSAVDPTETSAIILGARAERRAHRIPVDRCSGPRKVHVRESEMPALTGCGSRRCRLAWRRLDTFNQLCHPPVENIRRPDEVGPKGDEQVAGVALLLRAGPGEQSQSLYHQCQPEAFVTAERQQCTAACKRRVPSRLAAGSDCHAFGKNLA